MRVGPGVLVEGAERNQGQGLAGDGVVPGDEDDVRGDLVDVQLREAFATHLRVQVVDDLARLDHALVRLAYSMPERVKK